MRGVGGVVLGSLVSLAFLAMADVDLVNAQARKAPRPAARAGEGGVPQELVVCTGWHALCSASPDCRKDGDRADCDCLRVDETHVVETTEIQDTAVRRLTLARCTSAHPCDVDRAPVCRAIRDGQYRVDGVRYDWVSTYSYRGWCSLLTPAPIPCDQGVPGYTGDRYWAICDAAPCTENRNPSDPERPLSCRCRVMSTPFVGAGGSCTGKNGGIMSSFPLSGWDFRNGTYTFPMPGYEGVRGAGAPRKSDPWKAPRRDSEPR